MMKKKAFYLTAAFLLGLSMCKLSAVNMKAAAEEEEESNIKIDSSVAEEDCFICGDTEKSQMPYYKKMDSLGIIHWNSLTLVDSSVRAYNNDGEELFQQGNTSTGYVSPGNGYGTISVQGTPDRGYTDIEICVKNNDRVDLEKIKEDVCQECLNQIIDFYENQKNYGKAERGGTTGYCIVDYSTGDLYSLSEPYREYMIRDYQVRYDISEEQEDELKLDLFIFYAPKRTEAE